LLYSESDKSDLEFYGLYAVRQIIHFPVYLLFTC